MSGRADHLRQRFLTEVSYDRLQTRRVVHDPGNESSQRMTAVCKSSKLKACQVDRDQESAAAVG
jgi:hypothetical protein